MGDPVRAFASRQEFRDWLRRNHRSTPELLVRCYKVHAADRGLTYRELNNKSWALGIPVALLMLGIMAYVLIKGFGDDHLDPAAQVSTAELSDSIFKPFLLPFEALSFVLLAAVVGAIVLARKD